MISWSQLNEGRTATRRRWPTIWSLPRIKRSMGYAAARIRPGERVLDVGASDGRFGRKLPAGVEYRTLDTDPRLEVDYRSLDEVDDASIDVVACFEMIEHLELEDAWALVEGFARVLRDGGRLYLSTPNTRHPWSYRSATHKTPFRYDEFGGLLQVCGFELDGLFRCHHDALVKGWVRYLFHPLYRVMGIDYAESILAEAHRSHRATSREM